MHFYFSKAFLLMHFDFSIGNDLLPFKEKTTSEYCLTRIACENTSNMSAVSFKTANSHCRSDYLEFYHNNIDLN